MHNLSQRYGKLLSVGFSVLCSVFLVAVIVSAATTIGANISTGGNITPTTNDTSDIGAFGTAFRNVYVSGTLYGEGATLGAVTVTSTLTVNGYSALNDVYPASNNAEDIGAFATAWRNVYASGTLRVGGGNASSTIDLSTNPSGTNTKGKGTCLILMGSNGTQYFVSVTSTGPMYTSTVDCR